MNERLRNCICEFLGTLFITSFGCGILLFADAGDMTGAAMAVGMCIMAVTSVFFPFSGAHLNPAVSLAQLVNGKLEVADFLGYFGSQLAGVFAGFGIVSLIEADSSSFIGSEAGYLAATSAFALEAFCAFVFIYVYLEMLARPKASSIAPIIIGGAAAAIFAWTFSVTGSFINPFRSLAAAVFAGGAYITDLWIFLLAPFVGGALAGFLHPRIMDS